MLAEDSVALLDIPIADGPDSRLEPEPRDDMLDMPEEEFPTRGELNLDPILYGLLEKSELEVGQWFRKWRPPTGQRLHAITILAK